MWAITISGWHPRRLNELLGSWQKSARLKKADRQVIALAVQLANVPTATSKRRVSLEITLAKGQRAGDPDAYWKSLLDVLTHAGMLVDDNRQHCELGPVMFSRAAQRATIITLEDLE